jgi:hypothetical protein
MAGERDPMRTVLLAIIVVLLFALAGALVGRFGPEGPFDTHLPESIR